MMIAMPTLAVAFAAFCVWLTVRIVNRHERWAMWTLAAALILGGITAFAANRLTVRQMKLEAMKEFEQQKLRKAAVNPPAPTPDAPSESN
jgi:type VI protein secretion system component VasK